MYYSAFHWSEKARKYAETLGTIFNVKGRVNTVNDLPATGNKIGDVYLVGLTTDTDLSEYAWLSFDNVTRWEKLGSTATSLAFSALTGSPYDNTALKNALESKANSSELTSHTGNTSNPHSVTKAQVGLGNVDNTSDQDKPVSTATQTALNSKAGTSLDNLSADGQAILDNKLNKQMISNCITYIPQDIKLELNNETLTLKAGSKVYVPNGAGVFNTVTTPADTAFSSTNNTTSFVWFDSTVNAIRDFPISICYSGTTAPTGFGIYAYWYDTTNNQCKFTSDSGSTWISGQSLPIGIITGNSSTQIVSLDQVFNGFGYIGSTIFALPGVKGLIPNGRNEDGTLKSIQVELSSVKTDTISGSWSAEQPYAIYSNGSLGTNVFKYEEKENAVLFNGTKQNVVIFANATISSGKVTSLTPKTVFHAVDYNDAAKVNTDNTFTGTNTFPWVTYHVAGDITTSSAGPYIVYNDINGKTIGQLRSSCLGSGKTKIQLLAKYNNVSESGITIDSDSGNNSKLTISTGTIDASSGVKSAINNWGMPNYSAAVSVATGTDTTKDTNGIVYFSTQSTNGGQIAVYIDGQQVFNSENSGGYIRPSACFFVPKGKTFKVLSNVNMVFCNFAPCIGG